jgi:small subunit ribosomal protein S2
MISKEIEKMDKFIGGIRIMRGLPQVIVVTDPVLEHNAIDEARKLHIPIVALANTTANPEKVDFLIPANTNSIKTVYLLISILCDAVAEVNNEPLSVVGKPDDQIVLPEVVKRVSTQPMVSHKRFSRQYQSE